MAPRPLAAAAVAALALLAPSATALYINGSVIAPCDSPLYCQGDILKAIELARPFSDSKTFVDMPTIKPLDEVIEAFGKLKQPLSNNSELNDFLTENFAPAGGELEEVPRSELETNATFLDDITNPVIREFTEAVIDIWPDLTRRYVGAGNCSECANSFIPINRTFVVAGGRFREPYYWDSYWILEGLLRTGGAFTEISRNIIENFLDFVETIGFVPNGARQYYLNRSQPPLLTEMVRIYVEHTNDTSILERAVPLLIKEYEFWTTNRSVEVTAADGKKYQLNRYAVNNNQPRPESYREDYITANNASYYSENGTIYPETVPLNDTEKATLYANLATGAESGWDYVSRWISRPSDALDDVYFPLRHLNNLNMVPVDLNSILYQNEATISHFLALAGNATGALHYARLAAARSAAMHATLWNATLFSFFDYNLTSSSQFQFLPLDPDATDADTAHAPPGMQQFFHIAQLYPFWTGAAPPQLKDNPLAVRRAYARVARLLQDKKGAIAATNFRTGQQWDEPNVWPPLQHVLMEGLRRTPATFGEDDPEWVGVQELALALAQRYLESTFCTWYATGGETSATPRLAGVGDGAEGIMFEKYNDDSTNVAGGGGEYEVVEGFGWTNGVLIWAVETFGDRLRTPECGAIEAAKVAARGEGGRGRGRMAVEVERGDMRMVKRFGRGRERG
ncbi:glycoside hydrolase family 37 protein [Podospora conica]|nr:glycoside hydrolase family 37 protein [Schizothecium conicum]